MRASELNIMLAVVTSYLFENMTEKEFFNLALFLSLLSKQMFAMEAFRDLVKIENIEEKEEQGEISPEEAEELESELEDRALIETELL